MVFIVYLVVIIVLFIFTGSVLMCLFILELFHFNFLFLDSLY